MKKIISVLLTAMLVSGLAFAQKNGKKDPEQWREKVRAEQVGFITSELNLTESEAQAFWPVYNEIQEQRREAFKASADAFKALKDGAEGKETDKLLDQYLAAKKNCDAVEANAVARYKKVLPVEKVAKLLVAEEKFRHQQIGKLGAGKPGDRPGQPGSHRNGRMPMEQPKG